MPVQRSLSIANEAYGACARNGGTTTSSGCLQDSDDRTPEIVVCGWSPPSTITELPPGPWVRTFVVTRPSSLANPCRKKSRLGPLQTRCS